MLVLTPCQLQIAEIANGLEFRISELKQESSGGPLLNQSLDAIFQADDELLSSLQKLGWELDKPDPEEAKSTDKLRETCLRYVSRCYDQSRASN